jgi:DNA primase
MTHVDDVRDRTDIVQLVGEYVQVQQRGKSYKALCPFHQEKTPSFVLYPDEGRWHCFGSCATGGDAFDFVMRIENMDFKGALERLARRAGVVLEPATPAAAARRDQREVQRSALVAAAAFFQKQLATPAGAKAAEYLAERGFTAETIADFGLGWAPDSWNALGDFLKKSGYDEAALTAAGLTRPSDRGGVFDYFRGRLTIPIADPRGRIVGFGARTLDPAIQPKYVNSPQSDLFDKGNILYGLDRAAAAIRAAGMAVVVEGFTDVIRAHAAGHTNVVASQGTALTERHIARLKRYAPVIVLALDADAAGTHAMMRGLDVAREASSGEVVPVPTARGWIRYEHRLEVELRVATLPQGKDPDEVIREEPDRWPEYIAAAQPIVGFLIQSLTAELDLDTPVGKTEATRRLLPVLESIPDPVARAAWISELSDLIRVDPRTLAARLGRGDKTRRPGSRRPSAGAGPPDSLGEARATRRPGEARDGLAEWILGHLLRRPVLLDEVNIALEAVRQRSIASADFESAVERDLFEAVKNALRGVPPPDTPDEHQLDLLPETHSRHAEVLVTKISEEPTLGAVEQIRSVRDAVLRRRERLVRREIEGLRFLQAEAVDDERPQYDQRVRDAGTQLVTLQRLLAPDVRPQVGKLDPAVMRRRDI